MADTRPLFESDDSPASSAPYREAIGALLYVANWTRPDILFPVNLLARFNQAPKDVHWNAVKRVLRYLKQTETYGLKYTLQHISTSEQPADSLTKPLGGQSLDRVLHSGRLVAPAMKKIPRKSGIMPLIALGCVLALAVGQGSDTYQFVKTDPLVWRITDEPVRVGTGYVEINYRPFNPCSNSITDWASEHDIKKAAYQGLFSGCQLEYEDKIVGLLHA